MRRCPWICQATIMQPTPRGVFHRKVFEQDRTRTNPSQEFVPPAFLGGHPDFVSRPGDLKKHQAKFSASRLHTPTDTSQTHASNASPSSSRGALSLAARALTWSTFCGALAP